MKKYVKTGAIWLAGISAFSAGLAALMPSVNLIGLLGVGLLSQVVLVAGAVSAIYLVASHHMK